MASTLACTLGTPANGRDSTDQNLRIGIASGMTVVGGATGLASRSGIIPSGGSPLGVAALGTPALKVRVNVGRVAIQASTTTGGVYSVVLETQGDIDILAAQHATLPRISVLVAAVFHDGVTPIAQIMWVDGTPNASPVRPSITPPTNWDYFPLAQVTVVGAATRTTITNADIGKVAYVDGVFTAAPGGSVRGALAQWTSTRNTNDGIASSTTGTVVSLSIPAAEFLPGRYLVTATVNGQNAATGAQQVTFKLNTPLGSRNSSLQYSASEYIGYTQSLAQVTDVQPVVAQVFSITAAVGALSASTITVGTASDPSVLQVTRMSDL